MIVRTEAVVIKTMKYRESSRILTLYTQNFGKISVIAKGARDARSKLVSSLNLLNHVMTVIYRKEGREIQLLSQCDVINPHSHISDNLERLAPAMAVIELVNLSTPAEEENPALFTLVISTLDAIDHATKNASNALYFFEMRLLEIIGFRPNLHVCFRCGRAINEDAVGLREGFQLNISYGGVLCPECSATGVGIETLGAASIRMLQRLQELGDIDSVTRITLPDQVRQEVASALRRFLQGHVEGLRALKSEAVFASFL